MFSSVESWPQAAVIIVLILVVAKAVTVILKVLFSE